MNIFFCFKSDFSHLSLLKYLPASIKSFTSIHFTFYISYWQDFTHIHIICSIYIFEPSLPRQHHGNHTVGYCASYFVFSMNKYVNINIILTPYSKSINSWRSLISYNLISRFLWGNSKTQNFPNPSIVSLMAFLQMSTNVEMMTIT